MFRIVEVTLTLKIAVDTGQDRDAFYQTLESRLRRSFGDTLASGSDAVRVIGANDPDQIMELPIDIDACLARNEQVAVLWSVNDVVELRPDLTTRQAFEVLQHAKRMHDVRFGINWDTLDFAAEQLFGEAPEPAESANG